MLLPKDIAWGASGLAGQCLSLLLPAILTRVFVESILTALHDLLENTSCLVHSNNVSRACPVAICNLFPWDRCGCKPRAALNPAAVCSLVHHQRELPGDPRNAPAPGGGHAETRFTGTETFISGFFFGPWENVNFNGTCWKVSCLTSLGALENVCVRTLTGGV